jgi:hypothetical protein
LIRSAGHNGKQVKKRALDFRGLGKKSGFATG